MGCVGAEWVATKSELKGVHISVVGIIVSGGVVFMSETN